MNPGGHSPEPLPFGELGRLEYDEGSDTLLCHLCGEWKRNLAQHARLTHGVSADEYRELAGLNRQTRLISPGVRARLSETMTPLIVELKAQGKLKNWAEDPERWRQNKAAAMEVLAQGHRAEGRRHGRERWTEEDRARRADEVRRRNLSGKYRATPEAISAGLKRYWDEHPGAIDRERLREMGRRFKVTEKTARDVICPRCGETFRAMSHREKYCSACRPEMRRQYWRDYARRQREKAKEEN